MTERIFEHTVRVYFEDTDAGGIVYHANYLGFMERARGEMLRELGFEQNVMIKENNPLIVVSKIEIHYRRPAKLDDLLTIRTRIASLRRASAVFEQTICRGDEVLVSAQVRCASIDPVKGIPVTMYGPIYEAMAGAIGQTID